MPDDRGAPYAQSARIYWEAGWPNPLPVREKSYPPEGFTGYNARSVTLPDLTRWLSGREAQYNTALRMTGTVGIDVDAYDHKMGEGTFKRAVADLGPLPPTWSSTSRGPGASRIYLFRIPYGTVLSDAQTRLTKAYGVVDETGKQHGDIDIIHTGHRYAVVWPSIHPDTHQTYRWYAPGGVLSTAVPNRNDLPMLPEPWLKFLVGESPPATPQGGDLFDLAGPEEVTAVDNSSPEPTTPFDVPARLFTPTQAKDYVGKELEAFRKLRTPEDSGFNNKLNALACVYSHFVPEFVTAEVAERQIYAAAVENRSVEFQGERQVRLTIRSGLGQRGDSWKAVRADHTDAFGDPVAPEKLERPAKERLQLVDWTQLKSLPRPVPLMEGILDVATVGMLAGKFGTYKTFLALSWAAHIATGREWNGHKVPEARPVIYVYAEGAAGAMDRAAAWEERYGPMPAGQMLFIPRPVRIPSDEDMLFLSEAVRETGAGLIVFDTLRKSATGADLDTIKDVGPILDRVASLRDDHGVAALLIHHTGHQGERARGSSGLEDDIDSSFVITLDGDQEDRSPSNKRVLKHRKSKDGALSAPLEVMLETNSAGAYVDVSPWDPTTSAKATTTGSKKKATPRARLSYFDDQALTGAVDIAPDAGRAEILKEFRKKNIDITDDEARHWAAHRKSMQGSTGEEETD